MASQSIVYTMVQYISCFIQNQMVDLCNTFTIENYMTGSRMIVYLYY